MTRVAVRTRLCGFALGLGLVALSPSAGLAMCGGNIFMTCPPSAKAAQPAEKTKAKAEARRHKRLLSPGKTQ